ncbi:DegV family protein [Conexibacter arvalis]|uniref:DegV family protein with EDD domain n=1 Tax=Conexibacter arvalis TaxID=912552 RepID=A0A840IFC7_9ACTN|nr:DegV family protein [Conexibacter arvalis]MBB4662698.1 DegV family protein with EDD domain [Conexibacter arvalis]
MAPVAIVTDTCHYLPRQLVAARGIHEVSLYVHWDGREDREADLPDFDAYYEHLGRASVLPTTSQPSIGDFMAVYEPLLDSGRDVVSIHLSGGMSGTVAAAQQAREQLGERKERVHVLDSGSACGGEGLMVLAAHAAAARGTGAKEVVAHAREARAALKMWFAIDTLEYLRRGGRIAAAQAWLGSALRIKPILTVESEITPVERVRTSGRAFERMVDYLRSRRDDGADGWVIQHIQAPDECARLVERGREIFGTDPVFVSEVGPVIGTHVGPGLLGVGAIPLRHLG